MRRGSLLATAYLADSLWGDPEWLPHPVRLMGSVIARGELRLRRAGQSDRSTFLSGAGLTLAVVGASYCISATMLRAAQRRSTLLASVVELILAATCLASRNLEHEATAVSCALISGDLPRARTQLARIVGRDTESLDSHGISRAVIETVAESACDGIVAPMFYLALGGVPLAMAYKAVNTLDSMIGHADSQYFYFGKTAARLDDFANYLPSRITALALVAAAILTKSADSQAAWRIWQRDGSKHKSPNAGQPESAMAGALHVALGGGNTYRGEWVPGVRLGQEFPPATPPQTLQAIRLVSTASLIVLGLSVCMAYGVSRTRQSRHG